MTQLTFLTWNLAMMARSDYAPTGWRMDQTEAAIREVVLRHDPDVICFQELPGLVPYIDSHEMAPANARGQQGDIATLVRRDLMPGLRATQHRHAVLVELGSGISIANVHLPSTRGGDKDRLAALVTLTGAAEGKLVVVGDTNTRTREETQIHAVGLTGKRPPEPTWNGRLCRFRRDARGYTAYYTRVFHDKALMLAEQRVLTQPAEANGASFHLSDHFALLGTLALKTGGARAEAGRAAD